MLHRQVGSNSEIVDRGLRNIEYYSLKLSDLVLPVDGHRIDALAGLRDESLNVALVGERAEAVGLVGLVGLVLLATVAAVRLVRGRAGGRHGTLALIAGAAFAMGTVGGGATVLGVFGLTFLRAWSRVSVVVAFCALVAVGICLDRLRSRAGSRGAPVLVGMVLVIGVLDTNPGFPLVDFDHTAGAWASDRLVVEQVEELFGEGAQMFQLPVISFPEHPPVHGMVDYDHLRGYLHSDTLGWSYGGVKGRASDWQQRLAGFQPDEMATALAGAGFDAIWVDRLGFGPELSEIEVALGQPDLVSPDGRIAIHDLRPLADELLVAPGSAEVARAAAALLEPVNVLLGEGFHGPEFDAGRAFSWAPEQAEIRLRNPMDEVRTVQLRFVAASAVEGPWVLVVHAPRGVTTHEMPSAGSVIDVVVEVPPGETVLRLRTDAPRLETTDPRDIRFRVFEPTVVPAS
jgi:phosphoglycerol transferase